MYTVKITQTRQRPDVEFFMNTGELPNEMITYIREAPGYVEALRMYSSDGMSRVAIITFDDEASYLAMIANTPEHLKTGLVDARETYNTAHEITTVREVL